jgi:uncharacterized integral membrane protein
MRTLANLLTSIVLAAWIAAIALLSIQNITPISLQFLALQTIQIPLGLVLAFSVGVGVMGGAIAPVVWRLAGRQQERYYEEEEDF